MTLRKIMYLLRNFARQNTTFRFPARIGAGVVAITSIMSGTAFAAEVILTERDQQLQASCQSLITDPKHAKSQACSFYIRGFLAGVQETDNAIATELKKKYDKPETYIERAYKYRVGKRGDRRQYIDFSHFCVPDNDAERRIIKRLPKELPDNGVRIINDRILDLLKKTCPSVSAKEK
jgi:hypothetical protein